MNNQGDEKTKVEVLIDALEKDLFYPDPKVSQDLVDILKYFMTVEALVPVTYAPQLRWMPAYHYSDLRKFIDRWELEEARHGDLIRLYLLKHGYNLEPITKKVLTFKYVLETFIAIALSWPLYFISTGVYLVIGGANEATTSAGYWALMKKVEQYPLLYQIVTSIQAEEVKHLETYTKAAPKFLNNRWRVYWTKFALKFNWKPVGSRHGDIRKLIQLLLVDEIEAGFFVRLEAYLKKVNVAIPDIGDMVLSSIQDLRSND